MKHLANWGLEKKWSWCIEISPFSHVVLFQPLPIYRICQDRPIFLCEAIIFAIMGFPDDVGPFSFRGKFGGS